MQPGQPGVGRAWARFSHLRQPEVDAIGQDGGQQQRFVLGCLTSFQVGKVAGEAGPLVDLQEQLGDLDVRKQRCGLINQHLRRVWHRRIERRDLQARDGDDGVGQLVGRSHQVDDGQLLFKQQEPALQVLIDIGDDRHRQLVDLLHGCKLFGWNQVLVKVLELTRALDPDVARAQRVFQLRQRAQIVVAPVDAGFTKNQPGPRGRKGAPCR